MCSYFNTSNVTIQHNFIFCRVGAVFNFNTSNVTIQLRKSDKISQFNFISIHLMLLFNSDNLLYYKLFYYISIHLMLLFNYLLHFIPALYAYFNTSNVTIQQVYSASGDNTRVISIHLMLLFNFSYVPAPVFAYTISIHLMLLFNVPRFFLPSLYLYFNTSNVTIQLWICCIFAMFFWNFNTSNVTIQLGNPNNVFSDKSISIHLMLLFNL